MTATIARGRSLQMRGLLRKSSTGRGVGETNIGTTRRYRGSVSLATFLDEAMRPGNLFVAGEPALRVPLGTQRRYSLTALPLGTTRRNVVRSSFASSASRIHQRSSRTKCEVIFRLGPRWGIGTDSSDRRRERGNRSLCVIGGVRKGQGAMVCVPTSESARWRRL